MDNPLFVAVFVFILVLGVALLYQWRPKKRKQSKIGYEEGPKVESVSQKAPCEEQPGCEAKEESGLAKIRQMDPAFDESLFKDHVTAFYLQFLTSRSQGNIAELREQMTEEMFASLKAGEDRQPEEGDAQEIGNLSVRSVELTKAWQENGRDFIKVRYLSDVMDHCAEEKDEDQVCGVMDEKIDHVKDWIFSRISGANPWYLSAIEPV